MDRRIAHGKIAVASCSAVKTPNRDTKQMAATMWHTDRQAL